MKTILFTYITPFHPERGGVGRVTHTLTLELLQRGYKVLYLIYPCTITIRHKYDYPVPLTYLPNPDSSSQENIDFYHRYLQENKVDIVINQSGAFSDSFLWANTGDAKIKVISVVHQNPLISYKWLFREICHLRNSTFKEKCKRIARILLYPKIKYRFLKERKDHYNGLLPQTNALILLSKRFLPELHLLVGNQWDDKVHFIANPNSFDTPDFTEIQAKKRNEIVFVGLLDHGEKQPMHTIKIWEKLYKKFPDWKFIIVGGGKKQEYYENIVRERGIKNIEFHGFQNPKSYYEHAQIFCMPSLYEGWGMVLSEAMQHGAVPVVYSSFASVFDMVSPGVNGELVTPFSIREFAEKLSNLIIDDKYRNKLSRYAYENIQKFNVKHVADKWEKLFNSLII